MKKIIFLAAFLTSFSTFCKDYKAPGYGKSLTPPLSGCSEAKKMAIAQATYDCFQDGNQDCKLDYAIKTYSRSARLLFTPGEVNVLEGSCTYRVLVKGSN